MRVSACSHKIAVVAHTTHLRCAESCAAEAGEEGKGRNSARARLGDGRQRAVALLATQS